MKSLHIERAFYFNAAFFAIVPHGGEMTRLNFEMLLVVKIFGAMPVDGIYKKMHELWRHRRNTEIIAGVEYMTRNNYLVKSGKRYGLTDRSMLLIAQVERKLAAMVAAQFGSQKPGRPDEGKGYGRNGK